MKQNFELRRVQEKLDEQKSRAEKWIGECYRYVARAFTAYHNGHVEQGRMMHKWFAEDFDYRIVELERLMASVSQVQRIHFPRMSRLASDVGLLLEQAKDLATMLSTLNREYGVQG